MFDANILFYAYDNEEGDDFAVGQIGNKHDWIERINRWNRNDENNIERTVEDWDELDSELDLRGCKLAVVEPDGANGYEVTWPADDENDNVMRISPDFKLIWENNPQNLSAVPRCITRLKNILRETIS